MCNSGEKKTDHRTYNIKHNIVQYSGVQYSKLSINQGSEVKNNRHDNNDYNNITSYNMFNSYKILLFIYCGCAMMYVYIELTDLLLKVWSMAHGDEQAHDTSPQLVCLSFPVLWQSSLSERSC